ncbi:FAD-dependent oxidoreductase [Actinomadura sp. NPDC047616]|uniref:FAD-dependent oxidoreductase n=1 Tax=Actinomadura sp. NPDC047616 TaxID=3155914 RepID=UPI0033D778D0
MVLRPRLYEPEPDLAKVALGRILDPIGVEHLRASVNTIDTDRRVVVAGGEEIGYDRLVLAAGSALVRPRHLPGKERLFDIDTLEAARRLADHLRGRENYSVVVVGAGFTGLEAATELAAHGRVPVDRRLRALPEVFVAGDTAAAPFDAEHTVMQACQHATPMGKVAGYNAAADLLGIPPRDFTPGPYVTCLDLGDAGGIFTRGWDRRVMAVGTDGKDIKQRINRAIHPPVDDASKILAAADRVHIELPFFPRTEEATTPEA